MRITLAALSLITLVACTAPSSAIMPTSSQLPAVRSHTIWQIHGDAQHGGTEVLENPLIRKGVIFGGSFAASPHHRMRAADTPGGIASK